MPFARLLTAFFLLPLLLLTGAQDRPLEEDGRLEPFPGCQITRRTITEPRRNVMYFVRLDPEQVSFVATSDNGEAPGETTVQTTRGFLEDQGLHLAFNTHFYRLPRIGDFPTPFADLCGAAVSNGQVISLQEENYPAVEIDQENRLKLLGPTFGLPGRHIVVAGNRVLVEHGRSRIPRRPDTPQPRTALGMMADGTLLVVVVDGRQPGRSEGLTMKELADLLVEEGVMLAINLDGGGSTTLAIREDGQSRVVNVPVGVADRPGTERPVGFNLGVVARPPDPATQPAGE